MDFATNYVNALAQGGRDVQAAQHRNALLEMQQQGQAFNQGIAQQRLGMDQERLQLARDAVTRELANIEATQGAAAAEAERQRNYEMGVAWQTARQAGDMAGLTTVARELGIPVEQLSPEMIDHYDEIIRGTLPVLQGAQSVQPETYKPQSALGKTQADINAGILPEDTPLRGGPGVVVNNGPASSQWPDPPKDHVWVRDEQGTIITEPVPGGRGVRPVAVPIGGSSADIDSRTLANKTAEKDRQQSLKLGTTLENIALNLKAIDDAGFFKVTGPVGAVRRTWVGQMATGTDAVDVQNRTDQITDSAALAEVQNMRDNSPTGGAVGALTDDERKAIGNAVTAMNTATSAEEYTRAAKAYRELALNTAYGRGNWTLSDDGMSISVGLSGPLSASQVQGMTPDQIRELGPDGLQRIPTMKLQGLSDEQWDAIESLFE